MNFRVEVTNDGTDFVATATAPDGLELTEKAKTPEAAEIAVATAAATFANSDAGYYRAYNLTVHGKGEPTPSVIGP